MYLYDAAGNKLAKTVTETGQPQKTTQYIGGMIFENNVLQHVITEEGRARIESGVWKFDYFLKDHLGNTRIVVDQAGTVLQQTDYYPFGLPIETYTAVPNNYLYQGKELQKELTQFDFGARFYDPQIGRWHVIDPLAEDAPDWSPYNSMWNNPVSNIDPDGQFSSRFWASVHRFFNGGGRIGENEFGEWYVTKNRGVEVTESGEVIAKSEYYYGKGRNKYSNAIEAIERDIRIAEDIRQHATSIVDGEVVSSTSMYQMYDSPKEAGNAALSLGTGVVLPNPILKTGTLAVNAAKLANRGNKIVQGIRKTISVQKQARHLAGTAKAGGGFLNSAVDAQKVLDAVHSGEAVFLGTTKAGQPVFRYSGVTGTNVNIGAGIANQPTNVFIIKGTTSPSVVPTNPAF